MERAATYVRVSTEEQKEDGYGLAAQIYACEQYASGRFDMLRIYEDALTGKTADRPGIQQALADSDSFENLILLDHTRLGRTVEVSSHLRSEFERAGVVLHYVTGGGAYEPDSEAGILLNSIQDAMSAVDIIRMQSRLRQGRFMAAKSGSVQSGPRTPFGYEKERTPDGKITLTVHQTEAEFVLDVFGKFVYEGMSIGAIGRWLEDERVPRRFVPFPWSRHSVYYMLQNRTYIGDWYYGKTASVRGKIVKIPEDEWIRIDVPAIVGQDLFDRAQRKLAANKAKSNNKARHHYLLSGRIRCSECGDNYWGRATHSKGKIYLYYGHPYNECENRNHIRVDDLDSNIKSVIWEWSYDENSSWDDIMDIKSATDQIVEDQLDKVRADRAKLADKVAKARAELLDGLFDDDSHISADDVRDYIEKLGREDQVLAMKDDKLVTELKTDYIDLVVQQQDDLETMKVFDTLGADFYQQKEDEKNRRAESAKYHMLDDEANRVSPEFYTPEEWVELVQLFDVQVRVDRDKVLITCLAGERHLSVDRGKVLWRR